MDKPSANFPADLTALIVTVVCAVVLTPLYGVLGAAFSGLIGAATDAVIRWMILWRMMLEEQRKTGEAGV
ncbi:MAG: hypothetical protein IID45_09760 [Planctomycetes bacterium]|nr:hypothetical protein [Planctomycetota bacterium]